MPGKIKGVSCRQSGLEYLYALRDFNLVEQGFGEPGGAWVRVQFWLSYRRPDYGDQSLKEIVLRERNGLWLIAEERTLQVNIISD